MLNCTLMTYTLVADVHFYDLLILHFVGQMKEVAKDLDDTDNIRAKVVTNKRVASSGMYIVQIYACVLAISHVKMFVSLYEICHIYRYLLLLLLNYSQENR